MTKDVFDDIGANLERTKPRPGSRRSSDSKGYTNTKLGRVLPRYLSPPLSSCHDSCKSKVPKCNENQHGTAPKTNRRHSLPATKLQKTPVDENKKQSTSSRVNRRVLASADNLDSTKTKGTSRARQKGIPWQAKQDEENVPEKTLYVVEEHREDSTNHKLSPAQGEILEGPLHKDDAGESQRKVVQYTFVDGEEDSVKLLSGERMAENKTEVAEKDVKTLIGVFESVIALRDGTSIFTSNIEMVGDNSHSI
ncbi:unnamed protein product [Cuscuta campestris]|uniref:Calmodulin-binding domain-containing protein n=1 Tax=Cuscuta campestris TaxID=132261 RepID=A0A484LJW5_9ASTE|nr:unnamed protein product [Cuscuta campestris]